MLEGHISAGATRWCVYSERTSCVSLKGGREGSGVGHKGRGQGWGQMGERKVSDFYSVVFLLIYACTCVCVCELLYMHMNKQQYIYFYTGNTVRRPHTYRG